jgi:predicted RNase H-like nuclease
MLGNKKQARGREERLEVLRRYFPAADALLRKAAARYMRRQVALDDVIDAMVAAVTAKCGDGAYRTLPAERITDSRGNAMEIVYWQPV